MSNPNTTGDGTRGRYDARSRHDGLQDRTLSGDPIRLTPAEIAKLDPSKPTDRTIVVTRIELETIERSLEKVQEAVQTTLSVIHRKATKELQLLDSDELQALNTIATTLIRIKKLSDDAGDDPASIPQDKLEKMAK